MPSKGQVCVKTAGRDTGICVVLDSKDGKVRVMGPKVRKKWVNPRHLILLETQLKSSQTQAKMMKELEKLQADFDKTEIDPLDLLVIKAKAGQSK